MQRRGENAEREDIHKPFRALVSIRLRLFNISMQLEKKKVQIEREREREGARLKKFLPTAFSRPALLAHSSKTLHRLILSKTSRVKRFHQK